MTTTLSKIIPGAALVLAIASIVFGAGARNEVIEATRSANAATMARLEAHEKLSGHAADHAEMEAMSKAIVDLAKSQGEMTRELHEAREDLAALCVQFRCKKR